MNHIDERLYDNRIDGYRYEDMPPDREAYRLDCALSMRRMASHSHIRGFRPLEAGLHLEIDPRRKEISGPGNLGQMPIERFWELLVQDCVQAYYAHPWAWDEIGFGGPAYPRPTCASKAACRSLGR